MKNVQSRETDCIVYNRWRKTKNTTQYVLDTNYGQANTNIV